MSSGFVAASADQRVNGNDQDWSAAEQAIETNRKSQFDAGKQEGGKSLYEVLQQNRSKESAIMSCNVACSPNMRFSTHPLS